MEFVKNAVTAFIDAMQSAYEWLTEGPVKQIICIHSPGDTTVRAIILDVRNTLGFNTPITIQEGEEVTGINADGQEIKYPVAADSFVMITVHDVGVRFWASPTTVMTYKLGV